MCIASFVYPILSFFLVKLYIMCYNSVQEDIIINFLVKEAVIITTLSHILLDGIRIDAFALVLIFAFSTLVVGLVVPILMHKFKKSKCKKLTVKVPFIKIHLEK